MERRSDGVSGNGGNGGNIGGRFGRDGMRFGWDLMAKGWSGIWFMTSKYEANVTKGSKALKKEEKKAGAQELRHVMSMVSRAPPAAAPATVATAADATTAVGAAVATNVAVAAATAVTGAGAVAGTVDYHYGFRKSSLPLIKFSKKNKRKENRKRTEDSRHICISSPPLWYCHHHCWYCWCCCCCCHCCCGC